ncbi:unnamed protein product [Paramecium sonneborni]|uniref:Uncharacterized protein n=1 Tax=Paramecium sonneborni TaxID=65129 RepID=A0A8S1KHV9_9CILI|nr:unnamed protein product [Paramecium sonneborni]
MFEDVKSESIESNQKIDELNVELQQYLRKIITNLGENFLYLHDISKPQYSQEIIQSLLLLEQHKIKLNCKNLSNDISKQFKLLKSESILTNEVIDCQTDKILEMIQKQSQLEQQNNELLIKLINKQDENSKKLTDLQIDWLGQNSNIYCSNIHSLRKSEIEKVNLKISFSSYNSPESRGVRWHSMNNHLLSNIKLTHVSGTHNDKNNNLKKVNKMNPLF